MDIHWVSSKRRCTLLLTLFFILFIVPVSYGRIEQCPVETECMCLSLRMVNPTVIVRCNRLLIKEFPTMLHKVLVFFAFQTKATTLTHRSFRNATSLGMIKIEDNPITSIEAGCLSLLPNLEILEMAKVNLRDTSELHGLRTVIKLSLSDNFLKNFTTGSLLDVQQLDVLELDGNFINSFTFSHDKLKKLNLSRNNFKMVHKESFKDLSMLDTLDLSKNFITHLTNVVSQSLQSLYVAFNQIEQIDGAMWQDVPALKTLDVSNNQINDLTNISGIPFLENLNASNNLVEDLNSLHASETLRHLNLSHNSIKRLSEMSAFPLLETLRLAENAIEYLDGSALGNSPLLTYLSLEGNKLTELGPLSNNPRLVSLFLQNNKIENIQVGFFTHSVSLKNVDVGSNKLSDIQAFKNMPSLAYLNASENMIREIHVQSLRGCMKLSILDLSKNVLEAFPNFPLLYWPFELYLDFNPIRIFEWNKLQTLISLRRLSLNGTSITYLPPNRRIIPITHISIKNDNGSVQIANDALSSLVSLTSLSIRNAEDVSPQIFTTAHNLKRLELRSGYISEISTDWQFMSLEYIDLSRNQIEKIEIGEVSMARLKNVILTHNLIPNISFVNHIPNIVELNLRHNRIRHIPKDTFRLCSKLTVLDLSYNLIEKIIIGTFDAHRSIRNLYLSYNMLTNFSLAFDEYTESSHVFKSISVVHLDGNRISAIDSMTFKSCQYSLNKLNMSHNPLRFINETTFHSFSGIQSVDFSNTDIQMIPTGLFQSINSFVTPDVMLNNVTCLKGTDSISLSYPEEKIVNRLEMRHNNLTKIPSFNTSTVFELDVSHNELSGDYFGNVSGTRDLKVLDLSNNNIDVLDGDFIHTFSFLKHLNVSRNNLQRSNINLFDSLHDLETIDLTNNKLDGVEMKTTDGLKSNIRINLTGNPIQCNCSLVKFIQHLKQNQGLFGDDLPEGDVECQKPLRLLGEYVADVPPEQFQCKPELNPSKSVAYAATGDQVSLECPLRDLNGVNVTWVNMEEELENGTNIQVSTDDRLLIKQITDTEYGSYQCNATNFEGSALLTVDLHVRINIPTNDTIRNIVGRGATIKPTQSVMIDYQVSMETLAVTDVNHDPGAKRQTSDGEILPSTSSEISEAIHAELSMFCVVFNIMIVFTI
ncbi:protein artichoke-like [Lytechinus pictus]|uniref:protein artichoke-like n=1 Tax=Lytechinus pictus TaxID=7653 RepID=UPI0030B9D7B6